MARKKIDVFVPAEEQPYSVPSNWQWVRVGSVCSFIGGGTPSKEVDTYWNGTIPWASVKDIKGDSLFFTIDHITEAGLYNSSSNMADIGDLILVTRIEPAKTIVSKISTAINQDLKIVKSSISSSFLHFFFKTFQQEFERKASGSTVKGITIPNIESGLLPLPPRPEQQRIVNRIESLFAKLDEAKEKAQAVVDGFEDRKAAILHKAFTGELTAEWRKKTRTNRSSWQTVSVKEVCHDVKVGIVIKPSQFYTDKSNGTPAFRSANVREFRVDDFDWVYLNEEGMNENKRSIVHTGDVLVVRSGNPGTACVVEKKYDGYNAIDILIAVPDKNRIAPEYLCAFTNSPSGRKLVAENKRGMALTHFNVSGYSALTLELPSIPEQQQIIRIMQEMLEKEEKSKNIAEQVISQIDTMKKAILARAFRGELGTNDPSEPPADIGIS